jgi:hypothetical protein
MSLALKQPNAHTKDTLSRGRTDMTELWRLAFATMVLSGSLLAQGAETPRHVGTASASTPVEVNERAVRYGVGADSFEGRLLTPASGGVRGGLLFGPDWYGIYAYPLAEARRFAEVGFVVLVADAYGVGIRPRTDQEAERASGPLRVDRAALWARMTAA